MKRKRFISFLLALVISLPIFLSPLEVRAGGEIKSKNRLDMKKEREEKREKSRSKMEEKSEEVRDRRESRKERKEELAKEREEKRVKNKENLSKSINNYELDDIDSIDLDIADNTIEVKKDGPIKTIQKAIDIAYEEKSIENIIIGPGNYEEELIILRNKDHGELSIIGQEVNLTGVIEMADEDICKGTGKKEEFPKIKIEGLNIKDSDNKEPAITGCAINLDLKNLTIDGHYMSFALETRESGYAKLNIDNVEIKNMEGPFDTCNYDVNINKLNYNGNEEGLYISNCMDDEKLSNLLIEDSEFNLNKIESGSMIDTENVEGHIKNTIIKDNTLDWSLMDISNYKDENSGGFLINNLNIENNGGTGDYYSSLLDFSNMDVDMENINLVDNIYGVIDSDCGQLMIKDLNYENNKRDGLGFGIFADGGKDKKPVSLNNIKIFSSKDLEEISNHFNDVSLDISNVDIDVNLVEYIDTHLNYSTFDIKNIDFKGSGPFELYENSENKEYTNIISEINMDFKDLSSSESESYFSNYFNEGKYDLRNIKIKFVEFGETEGSEVNFWDTILSLQNIELDGIKGIEINELEGSLGEFLIDNLSMTNISGNPDDYYESDFPLMIEGGRETVDKNLKLKDIKISGGEYYYGLGLYDLDKITVYQLYMEDIDFYDFMDIYETKELNLVNNTFNNLRANEDSGELYLGNSAMNIYNTIFDINPESFFGEESKLTFKNSVLPSKYEDIEGIEELEISIDDTNLIGQALLDKEGVPIKDKSEDGDRLVVVDKGDNDYIKGIDKDLAGKERISEDIVDIGAFEYQYEIPEPEPEPEPEKPGIPVEPEKPIKPDPKPEEEGRNEAYIEGFEDGTVRPKAGLTKLEAAIVFYRLIDDKIIEENYSEDTPFTDIKENYWGKKYIGTLANLGIINGRPDGTFRPNDKIKRGELAKMIHVFEGIKKEEARKFNDIKGHWAEEYIKSASEKGWLMGDEQGNFRPDDNISRIEFIITVNRVFNRNNKKENMIFEGINKFKDVKGNEWYYKDLVEATNSYKYKTKDGEIIWIELIK